MGCAVAGWPWAERARGCVVCTSHSRERCAVAGSAHTGHGLCWSGRLARSFVALSLHLGCLQLELHACSVLGRRQRFQRVGCGWELQEPCAAACTPACVRQGREHDTTTLEQAEAVELAAVQIRGPLCARVWQRLACARRLRLFPCRHLKQASVLGRVRTCMSVDHTPHLSLLLAAPCSFTVSQWHP